MKNNSVEVLKRHLKINNFYGLALDIDDTLAKMAESSFELIHSELNIVTNKSLKELFAENGKYATEFWLREDVAKWCDNIDKDVIENFPLIEDVEEYVNKINNIVPIRAYITARRENLAKSTQVWLDKHNLPQAPLICRPKESKLSSSSIWKASVLEELYPNIVGIIDDNKYLTNELSNNYRGTHYLYGVSGADSSNIDVVACLNWQAVYEEIRRRYLR